jgi:hypothetical protein
VATVDIPKMDRSRDRLRRHVRRRKRIERAAHTIDAATAADAYVAFVGADDDKYVELRLAIGRLLVLLHDQDSLEER